jgi:hypothetical protein
MVVRCRSGKTGKRLKDLNANRRGKLQTARPSRAELSGLNQWKGTSWTPMATHGPVCEVRAALQLQIGTPSSLWSHVGSVLQLSDFCIALQFSTPMQAHLCSPSGVSKQLKVARASEGARDNASISRRRAVRISPSISRRAFNYSTIGGATVPTTPGNPRSCC